MLEFAHILYEIVIWLFILYSIAIFLIYSWVGLYAYGAVLRYKHENTFTDYNLIAVNPNAPRFSIIAPAFNEGKTIVDNVRSLLSIYYHKLEIIIVNDGSRDDSMEKLIHGYDLEMVSFFVQGNICTKEIRGVYKSKNPAFKKLLVVDKENGGKADALNVGVNISSGEYIVCIDVDCILEQDAILKLAKPFLEQTEKRVIACGGVIRLANNCKIENGKVIEVNLPQTWLGRTQALEYIRAFVLGRMAWSRASGLILISGAFGAFDKEIVLACGGYDSNTVGEDMELVVRMRRYMEEEKRPYEVVNIPDPLCWTEVPESKDVLKKQRNRWMRGTMETLWKHRKLMLNPKYGRLGMVSIPYWFFFELLGPIVEFTGYFIFLIFWILGIINWPFFFALLALVVSSGILYSIYAVLIDLVGHQVYTKRKDLSKLITTAVLEPIYFHPIVVKAGVQGAIDYFRKKQGWGEMTRQGFQQGVKGLPWWQQLREYLRIVIKSYTPIAVVFLLFFILTVGVERWWYARQFEQLEGIAIGWPLFMDNFCIGLQFVLGGAVFYLLIGVLSSSLARTFAIVSFSLIIITQFVLFLYFSESRNLLGADMFYYTSEEVSQILAASGMLSWTNIGLFAMLLLLVGIPFWIVSKWQVKTVSIGSALCLLGIFVSFVPIDRINNLSRVEDEFVQNAERSKWRYFLASNATNYIQEHPAIAGILGEDGGDAMVEDNEFPFLRIEDTKDALGPYFNLSATPPNLVVIIVEGLGHAYSSSSGYIGNFTPFIDSLTRRALYWSNNLSTSGRTFSVLPSLMGSLPFGTHGFLEQEVLPKHFNLFNVLKKNGFRTGFYYGGNADFDFMKKFIRYSEVDTLIDQWAYEPPYRKLPANGGGESWGYEDQAVFGKVLETQRQESQPYLNVLLTLSTHNPFLINNVEHYEKIFDKRLQGADLSTANKKWALENRKQLVSVLNLDEAVRKFFEAYEKRPDFKNTLFVITGDHAMPEIPLQSKIDRYHVPLIIYSPLLKSAHTFRHIVSHLDVTPSLLAYYRENYKLHTPHQVAWIGRGLSEGPSSRSAGAAMMQSKNQLIDFVWGSYHISNDKLFKLDAKLNEEPISDGSINEAIKGRFEAFKKANRVSFTRKELIPDSLYIRYFQEVTSKH